MHKFSAIFFALLLSLNVVSSLRLNPIDSSMLPSNSIRARLTQMLIQVQQTDNPKTIKSFLEEIVKMMKKLQEEQDSHKAISDKMMGQCKEEDEFRKKEVDAAADALNRGTEARNKCDASLQSAKKDLPELESALNTYESELQKATEQRNKEHAEYLKRKANYEEAIAFLRDFVEYVKTQLKDFSAFSFVEKSEKLLRHATKLGLLQHAVPVLVALASRQDEIPTTHNNYNFAPNQDIGTRLRNALDTLLARIEADWKDNEDTEVKAQEAFNILKAHLEAAIESLKSNIERTKAQIEAMAKCVAEEDAVIASASSKLNRNQSLKDSASKMCDNFAKEYIDAFNSRVEQIKTINEILVIIEKRFGQLPADLKSYLNSVENGWVAYQNSTEFQKFVEYQQQHLDVHHAGVELVKDHNLV